jgi:hypothetical protein
MKKGMIVSYALAGVLMVACNSAKRAEAEKQRNKEKMEQLEKDKQNFEQKNQKELR